MADGKTTDDKSAYQVGHGTRYQGRRRIYSRFAEVTAENVAQVVGESYAVHAFNVAQISYLRRYWRGEQPILGREKDVRPEINNKVVENRADEIMSFKLGYQSAEPMQYILSRDGKNDGLADKIAALNADMFIEGKEPQDGELQEWMFLCGVGYRMVEADDAEARYHQVNSEVLRDTAPFTMHVPDPRSCYLVYSKMYHHQALCAVWVGIDEDDAEVFTCYTPSMCYEVKGGRVVGEAVNPLGLLPIIEYDLNSVRVGAFEKVLPILDAINILDSNRLDGIEQVVQALYLFKNCQVNRDEFLEMLELGAVSVSSTEGAQGDVTLITNDLDQSQTQVVKQDLVSAMRDICGMPTKNEGGANDTGSAVYMRDGYGMAEAHAKISELQFKASEREFLRVVLRVCEIMGEPMDLSLRDIDIAFNRRNYDNVLTKAQTLTTMLQTGKVDPLDCFKACGLFTDPEAAYSRAVRYADERAERALLISQGQGAAGASGDAAGEDGPDGPGDGRPRQ